MFVSGTGFCIRCNKAVDWTIVSRFVTVEICGVRFEYVEQEAHCVNCDEPVYVPEINDLNVDSRIKAFEKKEGVKHES